MNNVKPGDWARIVDAPWPHRNLIGSTVLVVRESEGRDDPMLAILGELLGARRRDWGVRWVVSPQRDVDFVPDKYLRRIDPPADSEPTQETRKLPDDARLVEFSAELAGIRRELA